MIVTRIELPNGEGPYSTDDRMEAHKLLECSYDQKSGRDCPRCAEVPLFLNYSWIYWMYEMEDIDVHPVMEDEGVSYFSYVGKHFGFQTEALCREWFFPRKEDVRIIEDMGFLVVQYECPEDLAVFGKTQMAFVRDIENRVATFTPTEFYSRF